MERDSKPSDVSLLSLFERNPRELIERKRPALAGDEGYVHHGLWMTGGDTVERPSIQRAIESHMVSMFRTDAT